MVTLRQDGDGNYIARKRLPEKAFSEVKAQLDADAQVLRSIGARS